MAEIPSNGGSLAEGQHGASAIPVPNDGICRNSGTRVNRTGHPNTSCDDHRRRAHSGGETLQPHTSDAQIQVTHRVRDTAMFLYVDDGTFPFGTREDLQRGMDLIYHHFARFRLEMHIGRGASESKLECVFFPPPPVLPGPGEDQRRG